jgi:oligopeptide transport system substrate-binding protein
VQKERGEYLRQAWQAELGVQVREEVIEFGTTAVRQDRELPDLFFWGWVADYPDPDNYLRVALASMPTKAWRNPTYEQLVEKARRLTDQRQRMRLYGQADRILVEEAAIGPLFYPRNSFLIKPWVRRFPMSVRGGWFWKDVIIDAH